MNASNSPGTEGEAVIAINPKNPLNVVTFAVDYEDTTPPALDVGKIWYSIDGGEMYTSSEVPSPAGQDSRGRDPAVAFDRDGNLYVAHLTNEERNVSIAKWESDSETWNLATLILNSAGADKPWIMAAPTPSDVSQDSVYVIWGNHLSRSDNGGDSFFSIPSPGDSGGDSLRIVASVNQQQYRLLATWWDTAALAIKFNWGEYNALGGLVWAPSVQTVDASAVNYGQVPVLLEKADGAGDTAGA